MTDKVGLSRRGFLAANAVVAATAAVPSVAAAASEPTGTAPLGWHNVTAKEMGELIGERFRVSSPETGTLVMELVGIEPVNSGPARPSYLPRAEGVVALFDSPDKGPIVECGCRNYRVSHPRLGAADLFMGPSPLRQGGHVIEMVLN